MQATRRPRGVFVALTAGMFVASACRPSSESERDVEPQVADSVLANRPLIEIALARSPAECSGFEWPTREHGFAQFWALQSEANVRVLFDSQELFTSFSKVSDAEQQDGRIVQVSIAPLEKTVTFDVAVNYVIQQILKRVAANDKAALARAESWEASDVDRARRSHSLRFTSSIESVEGFCEIIRTGVASQTPSYYISLELYDRRVYGLNK
jgi:hypothetical protein